MNGWLSIEDVAAQLGIQARTVYRLINDGQLVAYRMGRVYRVRQDDVAAFLESARVKPGDLGHLLPDVVDLRASEAS